jgi:hypothetical protein
VRPLYQEMMLYFLGQGFYSIVKVVYIFYKIHTLLSCPSGRSIVRHVMNIFVLNQICLGIIFICFLYFPTKLIFLVFFEAVYLGVDVSNKPPPLCVVVRVRAYGSHTVTFPFDLAMFQTCTFLFHKALMISI